MSRIELAWWNYRESEKRVERCKAALDRTGEIIAQASADRWFSEWLNLTWDAEPADANDRAWSTGPSARPAPMA